MKPEEIDLLGFNLWIFDLPCSLSFCTCIASGVNVWCARVLSPTVRAMLCE